VCARNVAAVRDLERELPGRVVVRLVDSFAPEGRAAAERYAFNSHGIVVFDRDGALLFKQRDHAVNPADVGAVVRARLR
jgi:hypothetical protein